MVSLAGKRTPLMFPLRISKMKKNLPAGKSQAPPEGLFFSAAFPHKNLILPKVLKERETCPAFHPDCKIIWKVKVPVSSF
jgi:hypothetical protein